MKKQEDEKPRKDRVLAIRITRDEAATVARFAADRCLNVSALVRKLLFDEVRRGQAGGVGT